MHTARTLAVGLYLIVVFALLLVGLKNYFAIAQRAGIRVPFGVYAFRVYRFAFHEMKSSSETRWLCIGFGGVMLFGAVVPFLIGLVSTVLK